MAERLSRLREEQAGLHYRDRARLKGPDGLYARIADEFSTTAVPLT